MKIPKKTITITILGLLYIILTLTQKTKVKEKIESIDRKKYAANVIKVIDGDTIEIQFLKEIPSNCEKKERVRLIGINSPELNLKENNPEFYAKEAFFFTKKELLNNIVDIQFDPISSTKDKYNRLICYVYIDNYNFNRILIERGFAKYYSEFSFEKQNMELFAKAEKYAKTNKLGMWQ